MQARRRAAERRRKLRILVVVGLVVAAIAGVVAFRIARSRAEARRHVALSRAAGCGKVAKIGGLEATHLQPGDRLPTSGGAPPAGGPHAPAPLQAGFYPEPLAGRLDAPGPSIYQAVHSLEHGYAAVWYKDLSEKEVGQLDEALGGERKGSSPPIRGSRERWPSRRGAGSRPAASSTSRWPVASSPASARRPPPRSWRRREPALPRSLPHT